MVGRLGDRWHRVGRSRTRSWATSDSFFFAHSFLSKSDGVDHTRSAEQPAASVAAIPSPGLFMIWCVIDTSICMHTYIYIHISICITIYVYVCIYIHYTYMYAYIYICTYIYQYVEQYMYKYVAMEREVKLGGWGWAVSSSPSLSVCLCAFGAAKRLIDWLTS